MIARLPLLAETALAALGVFALHALGAGWLLIAIIAIVAATATVVVHHRQTR